MNETALVILFSKMLKEYKKPRISYVYFSSEMYIPIICFCGISIALCAIMVTFMYLEYKKRTDKPIYTSASVTYEKQQHPHKHIYCNIDEEEKLTLKKY